MKTSENPNKKSEMPNKSQMRKERLVLTWRSKSPIWTTSGESPSESTNKSKTKLIRWKRNWNPPRPQGHHLQQKCQHCKQS